MLIVDNTTTRKATDFLTPKNKVISSAVITSISTLAANYLRDSSNNGETALVSYVVKPVAIFTITYLTQSIVGGVLNLIPNKETETITPLLTKEAETSTAPIKETGIPTQLFFGPDIENNIIDRWMVSFWSILLRPYSSLNERIFRKNMSVPGNMTSFLLFVKDGMEIKVTLLKLLVMNRQIEYLQILLDSYNKDLNKQDSNGHTIAHYAAMVAEKDSESDQLIRLLKAKGVNFDISNKCGISAHDILSFRSEVLEKNSSTIINPYKNGSNLSAQAYKEEFKIDYLPYTVFTPAGLFGLSCFPRKIAESMEDNFGEWYRHIKDQFEKMRSAKNEIPKVYVCKIKPKPGIPKELHGQRGVRARKAIKAGELVGEYSGYYSNSIFDPNAAFGDKVEGNDNCGFVNASLHGNLMSFINHSAPNCGFISVLYKGFPHTAVVALRNIKEGECLYLNYGREYFEKLKINPFEFTLKSIRKFIEETENLKKINVYSIKKEWAKSIRYKDGKYEYIHERIPKDRKLAYQIKSFYNQAMIDYIIYFYTGCEMKTQLREKVTSLILFLRNDSVAKK